MNLPNFEQRLRDLEDNISKEFRLLKQYEDRLRITTDPREKLRNEEEIEAIRETAKRYQEEYARLSQSLESNPSAAVQFSNQLNQIAGDLNVLLGGQQAIQEEQRAIRGDLAQMRQTLLNRYDTSERTIIASLTNTLNQNQVALVQVLLDEIDTNRISEQQMQKMLAVLEQRITALHDEQANAVAKILKSPEVDFKHRLKVAVPFIPKLIPLLPAIEYEGELELGTGIDIGAVWEKLIAKLRGK